MEKTIIQLLNHAPRASFFGVNADVSRPVNFNETLWKRWLLQIRASLNGQIQHSSYSWMKQLVDKRKVCKPVQFLFPLFSLVLKGILTEGYSDGTELIYTTERIFENIGLKTWNEVNF